MDSLTEMEELFHPSRWTPFSSADVAIEEFCRKAIEESTKVKQTIENETVSYGPTKNQRIDIFGASLLPLDAPIFVFIHGGYWMHGSRDESSFMVEPLFNSGIVCCIVGYDLVPEVTISEIFEEIRSATSVITDLAKSRKSRGVYICGHSAGAHLAAMLLSTDIFDGMENNIIKGFILMAGIFDLAPLIQVSLGKELLLSQEIVKTCSPIRSKTTTTKIDVLIVAAKFDSPEFIRQSHSYYEVLRKTGINARFTLMNEDHFTLIIKLAKEDYHLTKAIIQMANSRKITEVEVK